MKYDKSKQYVHTPTKIRAIQYTGLNFDDVYAFAISANCHISAGDLFIENCHHGLLKVNINDYIIKGDHGDFYPCNPDVFKVNYTESKRW